MLSEPFVKLDMLKEDIAQITFFHPAQNSLPGSILSKLSDTITAADKDDSIEVIILKSGGDRTFCAGASFDELVAIKNDSEGKTFFIGFANVINACRKCSKIIIGRVQGKAVGGGVGLAAAVDYCLATKFAAVKLSELVVGIGPFVVGPAVERKIGKAAFTQLTLDAHNFKPAEWAKLNGLYADVFPSAEALDEAVLVFAETLCGSNPEARAAIKKIIWEGTEHWDTLLEQRAAVSGRLVLSDFTKIALKKFVK